MKRHIIRITLLFAILFLLPGAIIGALGSRKLVSPPRRVLQDYHHEILNHQSDHGLRVLEATAGDTPIQIYLPAPSPGPALKSRAVRSILTQRGIALPKWGETVGTILMLHGHKGRKEDNLPIAERFCAAGFACISCDLPGHGDHGSKHATFGRKEADLLKNILQAARATTPLPEATALFGISQGGAIALHAAKQQPTNYFAIASVATFAKLDHLIYNGTEKFDDSLRPLAGYCCASIRLCTLIRAGFDPADIAPVEDARSLQIPVLIGHGERDIYIPPSNARQIFEAIPHTNRELHLIPEGSHGDVLAQGGNEFYADLSVFFLKHLPAARNAE
jgi:pimeloyl-ACP methyl ester carboxylesterase